VGVESGVEGALERLALLPGVPEAVDAARDACTQLRWHRALRRHTDQARAEAGVRAARCSAALAGARLPVAAVRDAARGAAGLPDDAAGRTVRAALRVHAEAEQLSTRTATAWRAGPLQAVARLHVAAAAGLVPDEVLGRPRRPGEDPGDGADLLRADGSAVPAPDADALADRLRGLADLLTATPAAPAVVVAALVHAEVAVARPFVTGNGLVARALCRAVLVGRGLDPTGVAVWEAALLDAGPAYPLALAGYAAGTADGVARWLVLFAGAVTDGTGEGRAVCDAVLAGRLTPG